MHSASHSASHSSVKIAVVTGGSRGLGRSTVLNLAGRGVKAIFTYNSSRAEANNVVSAVKEPGARAIALQLDTCSVDAFDAFVQSVREVLEMLG